MWLVGHNSVGKTEKSAVFLFVYFWQMTLGSMLFVLKLTE